MIYTFTFNPSIDHYVYSDINIGGISRAEKEMLYPGGKGINTSIVLDRLGVRNKAVVVTGGKSGEILKSMLQDMDCIFSESLFGDTRINVKIFNETETQINGKGIVEYNISELVSIAEKIQKDDMVVISGSMNDYSLLDEIVPHIKAERIVFDIPKLKYAVKYSPFLVKPNESELKDYFTDTDFTEKDFSSLNSKYVLLSLGEKGATLYFKGGSRYMSAPKGKVISTVGAGDSMLAGFLYALTSDDIDPLMFSVACGSAAAFSQWLPQKDKIYSIYTIMKNQSC